MRALVDSYRPGVRNIGKNEIRKRYATGFIGLIISGALVYAIAQFSQPTWSLLVSSFPLFLGAEGASPSLRFDTI